MMQARRIYVANRGEIALRITRACESLGYESVLGVSKVDQDTLAARHATQTVMIGPSHAGASYLNQDAVLAAAVGTGCHAVHPGYGFLAENAQFSDACQAAGLVFIGAKPNQIEMLGDKIRARTFVESLGIPVSPGGSTETSAEALELAENMEYPILVKAVHGGGGRGMKLVQNREELEDAWRVASSEASAAFGSGEVFLEQFVPRAKHIEVQILGDEHGHCVHLGERECSVQYRYQKIIEEAPTIAIEPAQKSKLHEYAVRIARELKYVGLGTVEFLYDIERDNFYFLEVNTRVQVEHPVTEMVTGIDLIREQIEVAFGAPISFDQDAVHLNGHAIELRLNAQDPENDLRPSPGLVKRWRPTPLGGVRWDTHIYENYMFPPYYDSMMAKIIAYGENRAAALRTAQRAIEQLEISGLPTNRSLLMNILATQEMAENTVTTSWLEERIRKGV